MKLPKSYDPKQYEPTIYALWESSGAFAPSGKGEPYSIVLPPPNANGNLHIGHALTVAVEDILIRYHRMQGRDTIYIPGADHAGFETWVVYERELEKQGKSRFDYSREQLYSQVWDFVEKQRGNMELQMRELGASVSWDHSVFTLDKKVVNTVYKTFKRLWDDDLVYRGERIVNYCTKHQTAFADIEVEHRNEKSKLWSITYPLLDKVGEIIVATTRPETMLGDTAVAVHPDDQRYKDLIGKRVLLPLTDREIPIIADEAVDPTFGTGAVKVTPAHDAMDFEIGERHDLKHIQVIGQDGKMTNDAPDAFRGLDIKEARDKVLELLKNQDLLHGEEKYEHSVGHCYKCGTQIQPLVKDQWFVRMEPLVKRASQAIDSGEISFTPNGRKKLLLQYLNNLKDWNISRQIPWGIPVPAFQNTEDPDDWTFSTQVNEESITVGDKAYKRDEDTFDTWFSSGQWPFIVTDYLEGKDLSRFYPNSVMETGQDILYQWVARMVMLGLYATDKVPFKHIYLHGLVLDEHGKKMSKSKGNVINPQEVIAEFGSDALRMGIVSNRSAGQNQAFSTAKVIAARNFCNKLWNIARYIEDRVGEDYKNRGPVPQSLADHWVIRQLNNASQEVQKLIGEYRLGEAADTVYHTVWNDVADWYIESSKLAGSPTMLAWVLETALKLSHPFTPFVTETIWETLAWEEGQLITSKWPVSAEYHELAATEFEQVQKLVSEIRLIVSELGGEKQVLLFENDTLIHENAELIRFLANLKTVKKTAQPRGLRLAVANREAWLDLDSETLYEHQTKLETRLTACREHITQLQNRLANDSYVKNAPANLVEETRTLLEEQQQLEARLVRELEIVGE
jgi:valyl-tRNA synthetase